MQRSLLPWVLLATGGAANAADAPRLTLDNRIDLGLTPDEQTEFLAEMRVPFGRFPSSSGRPLLTFQQYATPP